MNYDKKKVIIKIKMANGVVYRFAKLSASAQMINYEYAIATAIKTTQAWTDYQALITAFINGVAANTGFLPITTDADNCIVYYNDSLATQTTYPTQTFSRIVLKSICSIDLEEIPWSSSIN